MARIGFSYGSARESGGSVRNGRPAAARRPAPGTNRDSRLPRPPAGPQAQAEQRLHHWLLPMIVCAGWAGTQADVRRLSAVDC